MKILRYSFFWFFCFTVIFLLALDFWSWERDIALGLGNLPVWLFYFIGLQITLAIAIWVFTQKFWTAE